MRRSRKYSRPFRPLNIQAAMGGMSIERGRDGANYKVRKNTTANKEYVCPGCNGIIPKGARNVVAWTEDTIWGAQHGVDSRRHWHPSCWQHRGPVI